MSCDRFKPAIAAHAAGADVTAATARHLTGCAACRQLLEGQVNMLAELDAELMRSLSISASSDFVPKVVRATRDAHRAPRRRRIPAPLWAGAAMAAAIVLALWLRQPAGPVSSRKAEVSQSLGATPSAATAQVLPRSGQPPVGEPRIPAAGRSLGAPTPPARARASSAPRPAARRAADVEPPVIVEPTRALAIQRLRELMTEGRLDERTLPPPLTPEAALAELTIAPIEIDEIRVPDVEIVGRPPAAPQRQ